MDILFEMISPPVWQDSVIQHVNFPDHPRVETSFSEYVLKHVALTNLHVSATHAKSFHRSSSIDCTKVAVVQHPPDGGKLPISGIYIEKPNSSKFVNSASSYFELIPVGTKQWRS